MQHANTMNGADDDSVPLAGGTRSFGRRAAFVRNTIIHTRVFSVRDRERARNHIVGSI